MANTPHPFPSHPFPSLGQEFEPFLYAVLYEDGNGMPLTMVSALARSGVDPWREAERIARMPKTLALEALARIMPERSCADAAAIADRLFALLPTHGANTIASVAGAAREATRWSPLVPAILILLVTLSLVYVFQKPPQSDAGQLERPVPPVADKADP
jgi:hypothetical protein